MKNLFRDIYYAIAGFAFDYFFVVFPAVVLFLCLVLLSVGAYQNDCSIKAVWVFGSVLFGFLVLGALNQVLYTEKERASNSDWILLWMMFR
jgi:hypothetical protein